MSAVPKLSIEKLKPCEIRAADMLCHLAINGQKSRGADLAKALGISGNSGKHYIAGAMQKTGYFSKIRFVLAWRCPVFRIGTKGMGIE